MIYRDIKTSNFISLQVSPLISQTAKNPVTKINDILILSG